MGASSGAGASSGMGASSSAGGGAGSSSGSRGVPDEGDDGTDAGLSYVRTDSGPALYEMSAPQAQSSGPTITFDCLRSGLPVGSNGLPNCFVAVERPLGSETLAECQQCDDVPGLAPFVPSVPLSELGDGLTNDSCLCTVTPTANPAACPFFGPTTTASWCYVSPAQAPETLGPIGICPFLQRRRPGVLGRGRPVRAPLRRVLPRPFALTRAARISRGLARRCPNWPRPRPGCPNRPGRHLMRRLREPLLTR